MHICSVWLQERDLNANGVIGVQLSIFEGIMPPQLNKRFSIQTEVILRQIPRQFQILSRYIWCRDHKQHCPTEMYKHHIDDFAQIRNLTPEKQFVMDKKYTKKNVVTEIEEVSNRKCRAEATM